MLMTECAVAASHIRVLLYRAERILLLSHLQPDGDAVGCLLGLSHLLAAMDKLPLPVIMGPAPDFSPALPGSTMLISYEAGDALPEHDLIWVVDTATAHRLGSIAIDHPAAFGACPILVTDHHPAVDVIGDLQLINSRYSSCAELLVDLAADLEIPISAAAATCLLLGIIADTRNFQISTVSPATLRRAAQLIDNGADKDLVLASLGHSIAPEQLRLSGMALAGLQMDDGLYWFHVTLEMFRRSGADPTLPDASLRIAQATKGMQIVVSFREQPDGSTIIGLRCVAGIDISGVARRWGGGGHHQAAGAILPMPPHEAERAVLPLLRVLI